MNFFEPFRIALGMLRLHPLRAFLTMLGVIIGVMSVTLISMISNGFQYYITHEFKKLGADTIFVMYDRGSSRRSERSSEIQGLTMEDVDYIMARCTTLDLASAITMLGQQPATYLDREVADADVNAVDENMPELNKVGVEAGRHINKNDLETRANVCVIGKEIATRLFGSDDPIGRLITFPGITLEVIGVSETIEIMGESNAKDILVPLTTAQDKWIGGEQVTYITVRPKAGINSDLAMDDLWRVLMQKSGGKRIYRVDSREAMMAVFGGILGVAGGVLAGIAALSLLVGGIGIMNIMLVSVTERTKEIGLRKAVGAKRGSILTQFLVESAMLSLVGGMIGMMIAWVLGLGITALTTITKFPSAGGLQIIFPIGSAIFSMAVSAIVGVVFGIYPAGRASGLSPIEALRTE
ncbi:ABC transporter permease [Kamptonema cortianum]|nr:ABC transporter permease [Geitlerinema splendidum]MDK3158509.1 ABC transporter permease [Kamptonema cortianum]